ncbi:hypothetical protein [Listeria booriae]|uniref:hypothetical protein n=1 Tax=Listeria booriae TaxID=1552123 RepID=UPI00164D118C|nr:hypothetical protein [Listeria booriae]MBC6305412.1 hypothetical protein [Listeria booriae]
MNRVRDITQINRRQALASSLIRFRSVAGGAREISSIFWSMGIGLATGMDYLVYALIFSVFVAIVLIALTKYRFGAKTKVAERSFRFQKISITRIFSMSCYKSMATKYC